MNKRPITIQEMMDGAAAVGVVLDDWDLHVTCNKCGHVQCVEPAATTADEHRIYGSSADFCDKCGSSDVSVREPDGAEMSAKVKTCGVKAGAYCYAHEGYHNKPMPLDPRVRGSMTDQEKAILEAARAYVVAQRKFSKACAKTLTFGRAQKTLHEAQEKLIVAVEAESRTT